MPKLINRYGLVDQRGTDGWVEYTGDAAAIPVGAKVLLPLTEFREFSGTWLKHVGENGALGVRLSPSDDLARLSFRHLSMVAATPPPRCCASAIATSASCARWATCCAIKCFC
jgi:uncharacterized protein (DUF934 family)